MRDIGLSIALFSLFYLASGVLLLLEAILSGFASFHIGILGVLSIALSLMAMKKRREVVTLLLIMFIPMVVFGAVTLYSSLLDYLVSGYEQTLLVTALAAAYLVAVTLSFLYVVKNRNIFT